MTAMERGPAARELDAAAAELRAARAAYRDELLLAGEWTRACAEDDPVARTITERIEAARDRMKCAGIGAVTAMHHHSP